MSWECYKNAGRLITGYKVVEMFAREGIKVGEEIYQIINDVLNEYSEYIFGKLPDVNEVYSKVKERIVKRYINSKGLEKAYEKLKDFLKENIKI